MKESRETTFTRQKPSLNKRKKSVTLPQVFPQLDVACYPKRLSSHSSLSHLLTLRLSLIAGSFHRSSSPMGDITKLPWPCFDSFCPQWKRWGPHLLLLTGHDRENHLAYPDGCGGTPRSQRAKIPKQRRAFLVRVVGRSDRDERRGERSSKLDKYWRYYTEDLGSRASRQLVFSSP